MIPRCLRFIPLVVALGALASAGSASERREERVPVVRNHTGGSSSNSDMFQYSAPTGWFIVDYEVVEISRGGDANYTTRSINEKTIEIPWTTKSYEKKVLGAVVDTKTARLNLDLIVRLEKEPEPIADVPATPADSDSEPNGIATGLFVGLFVTIVGGLILAFLIRKLGWAESRK